MMEDFFIDNCNGIINIKDGLYVFFCISDDIVTLCPTPDKIDEFKEYVLSEKIDSEKGNWMYGTTEKGNKIVFFRKKKLRLNVSSSYSMAMAKFYSPITIMQPQLKSHIKEFDSIEFFGGVVDILYPPSEALNAKFTESGPMFKLKKDYEKTFDVNVNDEDMQITYSINVNYKQACGEIPDFHKTIHSSLKLSFRSVHSFDDILKYYRYAHSLFVFCTGRKNICSEVRIYKDNKIPPIHVKVNEDFENFANDKLKFDNVISFVSLSDKLPKLFKLLNEEETAPNLLFLPEHNKYYNYIKYTDVTDICSSLDREYSKLSLSYIRGDKEQAEILRKFLYQSIDNRTDISEKIKGKAKNLLNPLKNFSPSLKEKIETITDIFFEESKQITEQLMHDKMGITFYDKKDFNKMVSQFIKIRNSSAHAGICWNEGSQIAPHLMLYIYYCILKRTDFNLTESTDILCPLFKNRF